MRPAVALLALAALPAQAADCRFFAYNHAMIYGPCEVATQADGSFLIRDLDNFSAARVEMRGPGWGEAFWNRNDGTDRTTESLGVVVQGGLHPDLPYGINRGNMDCWIGVLAEICLD
jgi:hypothetical protein